MEKLQPVIKQAFWICFGFALILILVGWWTANGKLTEQIEARKGVVESAFQDAAKGSTANPRWTEQAKAKNEQDQKAYDESALGLWKRQKAARTYPASIEGELRPYQYGTQIDNSPLRRQYAKLYWDYFLEQLKVIKPFVNGQGLVKVNLGNITIENYRRWLTNTPTSDEIWKAQEDIWLLRSIFDAIERVNGDASTILDASMPQLLALKLRGGDRNTAPPSPGSGGGGGGFGAGAAGGDGGGIAMEMMGIGRGGGGGGGATGGGPSHPGSAFVGGTTDLLTEEFGSASGGAAAGGGQDMNAIMQQMQGMGTGSANASASAPREEDRYVDGGDEGGLPYKTRAFFLHVKVLQDQIPTLLAELTDSAFPVEIVRVDVRFPRSGGGRSGGGMGGMMTGGGMDGGYAAAMGGSGGMMGGGMDGGSGAMMGGSGGMMGGGMDGGYAAAMGGGGMMGGGMGAGQGLTLGGNTNVNQREVQRGEQNAQVALASDALADVKIAGLMTLYVSQAENIASMETEAAAVEESKEVNPDAPPVMDNSTLEPGTMEDALQPGSGSGAGVADPGLASDPLLNPDGLDSAPANDATGTEPAIDPGASGEPPVGADSPLGSPPGGG